MAVGVERPAKRPANLDHAAPLIHPRSTAMSYNPLPLPTGVLPVTDPTSLARPQEDLADFSNPQLTTHPLAASPQQSASKKRRPSKGKVPAEIRRSSSTPHMRNLALGTSGELSPTADKRRNKLGYHRTSVACGHCRRRKIRCLLSPDDPQGRCANCIRLKKECNFYPVEQNPENQRSQSGAAKDSNTGAPTSSTTSSPRHPPSISGEAPFAGPPSANPAAGRYGVQPEAEIDPHQVPHSSGIHTQNAQFAYPHAIDTQWPPTTGFLPSSSLAESSPSSSGYWRPSPTTTSAYGSESNISGAQTPATMSTTSNMSYGGHPENHGWSQPNFQPPTRSMSYGNIEGLPQQYSAQGLGIQQDYPRRTSPYPYPTIDTNPSTIHSGATAGNSSAPLSAPILPNHQYSYPPPWNPYGGMQNQTAEMPMPGRSMSAQWYSEPGQLDQVQEEGAPPMTYTHHGMSQFYSGA